MAQVIAIANEKGGVAKTTTTLSLGAALAELGQRILLIDLDPQANLSVALGFDPSNFRRVVTSSLLKDEPLAKAVQQTAVDRLSIIPTNRYLQDVEHELHEKMGYAARLRYAIRKADFRDLDLILIDCPPSLGIITLNALTAASLLIIPTQAEYFSASALRDMMTTVRKVRTEFNKVLSYLVLITMYDVRNHTHKHIRTQLETTFGKGLLKTVIETDTLLRESPSTGRPITHYKPSSRGALQYRLLAEEVLEYVEKTDRKKPKRAF